MAVQAQLIGVHDCVEYYWMVSKEPGVAPQIVWRVPAIREAIRARNGYKILSADYSQIEVRLMAFASGDPWLIEALNSGKDIHCYMAADVFGIPYDELFAAYKDASNPKHDEYSTIRSNVKTVTFGVPYGAGAGQVALMTGLTEEEAQALIDRYFSKAKVLKKWLEAQGRFACKYGYSRSIRGRMRFYRLPAADDPTRDEQLSQIRRYAGNQPIQSGCADMLKPSKVRIYRAIRNGVLNGPRLYDARIILTVHDEIVMEVLDEHVESVTKIIQDSMMQAYDAIITGIKNTVDVTVGDYWKKS